MNVLEATEDLIQEVLDELLLEWSACQQSVQVGTEKLRDKVDILEGRNEDVRKRDDVFMSNVLEQLELSVRALGQDWCTEGLHDLLDRHRGTRQLVLGRANETKGAHADGLQIHIARRHLKHRPMICNSAKTSDQLVRLGLRYLPLVLCF